MSYSFYACLSSLLFPRGLSKQLSFVGSVEFQAVPCWGCVCKGEVHMSCPLYQQHFSTCRMHLSNRCCYFISYVAFWSLSITFRLIGKSFHRFLLEPHSSPKKARQVYMVSIKYYFFFPLFFSPKFNSFSCFC